MNGTVERELKLRAPARFSLARMDPQLDGFVASPVRFRRLHTVYYDTPDLRLARWGCSLRFRSGEGWTLKLPVPQRSRALIREEHVFPGERTAIPAGALDLATAYLRGVTPAPVAELRTVRTSRHVLGDGGDDLAEVVEDDVRVVDGTHVVRRFRQVEIELSQTAPDELLPVFRKLLRDEGAGKADPVPKNVRALGSEACVAEIDVVAPSCGAAIGEVARAAFAVSVERFVRYDAKLRSAADEDAVHQARVCVRRLRSDLRTFLPLLDARWSCELRDRLRWPQDVLSAARDADVMLENLRRDSVALPEGDRRVVDDVLAPLRSARDRAYDVVRAMLHDSRYVPLLCALVDAAKRPPLNERASEPAEDAIAAVLRDGWATLRRRVRRRSRPPSDRELHAIRIAAKRERYAIEAIAPIAGRATERFGRELERLQTVLGEQHDAVMACERLRSLGADGAQAFVAGELAAVVNGAERDARRSWWSVWRAVRRTHRRLRRSR
jgi:CHAD domain-containing protein